MPRKLGIKALRTLWPWTVRKVSIANGMHTKFGCGIRDTAITYVELILGCGSGPLRNTILLYIVLCLYIGHSHDVRYLRIRRLDLRNLLATRQLYAIREAKITLRAGPSQTPTEVVQRHVILSFV